jgi:hypothetical protein
MPASTAMTTATVPRRRVRASFSTNSWPLVSGVTRTLPVDDRPEIDGEISTDIYRNVSRNE